MSQISGAGMPIFLGGQEYTMHTLSDKDNDELTNWVRSSIVKMARDLIPPDADADYRDDVMRAAIAESRKVTSWMQPVCKQYLFSIEGVARIVLQTLKKAHPRLTHQKVISLLQDPTSVLEFNEKFAEQNAPPPDSSKEEVSAPSEGSPKE